MTLVLVDQGEADFLELLTSVGYTLRLYTTDVTDGLTAAQIQALTEADFTEATFTGYAGIALSGGGWTVNEGDPAVATYARQQFTSTADQTPQSVYGYYATRTSDGALQWFERFDGPPAVVEFTDQFIRVTPRLTLTDKQD